MTDAIWWLGQHGAGIALATFVTALVILYRWETAR